MDIDVASYSGLCSCGATHHTETQYVSIEPGAFSRFDEIIRSLGLTPGKGVAVYDENTFHAVPNSLCATKKIVLNSRHLHANEAALSSTHAQLPSSFDYMIAVGSGTIHDITRHISHNAHVPFISVPTACSVDGFLSSVSALTLKGCKVTLPGQAPLAVIADTNIFANAPIRLALSGVGDIIGKYISIFDWRIGCILTGEPYCNRIADMQFDAIQKVYRSCRGLLSGDTDAYESLMYALLLSGLSIQMFGNSRPASAAEHHISHFIEMNVVNEENDALHGEKVGVGTLLAAQKYNEILSDPSFPSRKYCGLDLEGMQRVFGSLYEEVLAVNTPNSFTKAGWENLKTHWDEVKQAFSDIPSLEDLRSLYRDLGAKATLSDIDLDPSLLDTILTFSPYVRSRVSLMRVYSQTK